MQHLRTLLMNTSINSTTIRSAVTTTVANYTSQSADPPLYMYQRMSHHMAKPAIHTLPNRNHNRDN